MTYHKKIFFFAATACLFAGIIAGAAYMAASAGENELYEYLSRCFDSFSADNNRFLIFKNSFADNIRLVIIITACSFFRLGAAGSLGCCLFKGFTSGFTTAAFVKYYGIRGLLVPISSIFSTIVFLPSLIIFCACSADFSLAGGKKDKSRLGRFLILAAICTLIFCIASFFDGYVTSTFIKLMRPFICKIS